MKKRRYFSLLCLLVILCIGTKTKALGKSYGKYSNRKVEFGLNLRRDHKKPECAKPKGVKSSRIIIPGIITLKLISRRIR